MRGTPSGAVEKILGISSACRHSWMWQPSTTTPAPRAGSPPGYLSRMLLLPARPAVSHRYSARQDSVVKPLVVRDKGSPA